MLSKFKKLRQIFTRQELVQVGILLIAILVTALLQAAGTFSVLPFIRLVMDSQITFENRWLYLVYDTLNFTNVQSYIIFIGLLMFMIIFLSNAVSAFTTWLKIRFVWMNNHRLSRRLLEKYLSMPYTFFLNQNSSDLSKNVLAEVKHLTRDFMLPMLTIINKGMNTLFILLILFWVDIVVSFVAFFVIGGSYFLLYWRMNRKLELYGSMRMNQNKLRYKTVKEAFGGIKEIKILNREPYFVERYSKASLKTAKLQGWNAIIGDLPHYALETMAYGGIIIFVLILLMTQEGAYQFIPLAGLFVVAGMRLMPSMKTLFQSYTRMQFNQAVLDRIYDDVMAGEIVAAAAGPYRQVIPEPLSFTEDIRLDNVTYNYPNTSYPVIEDINLTIKCNSMVAFVGPTGAGKTTLVDIILGLLPPQEGQLLVDGIVINRTNLANWQVNIGYVPQSIYLSDDSIARNIAFGVPDSDIDEAVLHDVAKVANLHDFIIEELPKGYDTKVGDRGIRLSGGQRQRVGIARALYHNPKVLVFDEATSALDGITEEAVLTAMENAAKSKTLLIIAHRLTTVKNCEQVYIIDKGKIVGSGTYEQLLSSNRQFQAMARAIN